MNGIYTFLPPGILMVMVKKKNKKTITSGKEPLWVYLLALIAGMYIGLIIGVPIIWLVITITTA